MFFRSLVAAFVVSVGLGSAQQASSSTLIDLASLGLVKGSSISTGTGDGVFLAGPGFQSFNFTDGALPIPAFGISGFVGGQPFDDLSFTVSVFGGPTFSTGDFSVKIAQTSTVLELLFDTTANGVGDTLYTLTALSTFTIPLAPPMIPIQSNTDFFDFFDFGTSSVSSLGSSVTANMTYSVHEVNEINVIPVPASIPLLLTGLGGFYVLRRRRMAAN